MSWDEVTQTIPKGATVLQVTNVMSNGDLMIPFGLVWDGTDTQWASTTSEGMSFDSSGMVAHDRIGDGMWGADGRDQDALAFVSLVLSEDTPATSDGSLRGGHGVISKIEVAFAPDLPLERRSELAGHLAVHHGVPVSEIDLTESRRRVPALKRRARQHRIFRLGVLTITPFAFVFALVAWPFMAAREAIERRKK